jgi:HEAT repeat protein
MPFRPLSLLGAAALVLGGAPLAPSAAHDYVHALHHELALDAMAVGAHLPGGPRLVTALVVPRASVRQDPADSLYRTARAALSEGDYDDAAARFREIVRRYPRSAYAADALYYEAFARYRAGGSRNLRAALAALDAQRERYANAATRDDATALATRIRGELARGGDAEAAAEVTDRARAATSGCPTGESDDERVAALNALAQMDAAQAVPVLERVLARRDACSVPLRRKAVFLLSQQRSEGTADALLRVAQTDPDAEVRQQAVFWLSQVRAPRATELLAGIVNGSGDRALKERAIFALSQQPSERAAQILREIAAREGSDDGLRERAIFWLGQRRNGESTAFLRDLYGRLRSTELRERVLFSLSQQREPASQRWLLDIAQDPRESIELRKKALFWASQAGVGIQELGSFYGRVTERALREQLVFVLSQRREPEAVDRLIDVARRDPDPELRKKAIFWLGQSRDPRATTFLTTLLDR